MNNLCNGILSLEVAFINAESSINPKLDDQIIIEGSHRQKEEQISQIVYSVGLNPLIFKEVNENYIFRISQSKITPSREEFIQAVLEFEKKHQVKLENFLSYTGFYCQEEGNNEKQRLREAFLTDRIIQSYLSRGSKFVNFLENRPDLISDENKPLSSDYYECKIYELGQFGPYRSDVKTDQFYLKTTKEGLPGTLSNLRCIQTGISRRCKVIKKFKIEDIRNSIKFIELMGYINENGIKRHDYKGNQFLLSTIANDGHATSIISILDKETFKHLASIFINSVNENLPFVSLERLFNSRTLDDIKFKLKNENDYARINKIFKEKTFGKKIFVDYEKKEGYLLNPIMPGTSSWYTSEEEQEIDNAYKDEKINFIHKLDEQKKQYILTGTRPVPFIDAPHNLQTHKEDENCAIYSYNFLQGSINMLENGEVAERIYRLAKQIDYNKGNNTEREGNQKAMATIFQEELKQYLPEYYDANGVQKSDFEIKQHHLNQRWNFGNQGIQPELLRKLGYLAEK